MQIFYYVSSHLSLSLSQVLYGRGVEAGWLRYIPNAEIIIYAISTGWLFHGVSMCGGGCATCVLYVCMYVKSGCSS